MNKTLRDLLTGSDNTTHDLIRWAAALAIPYACAMQTYVVAFKSAVFSMQEFGIGLGAVIAAVGAALKMQGDIGTPPAKGE